MKKLLIVFLFASVSVFGQGSAKSIENYRHAVMAEGLGSGFVYSIQYEYLWLKKSEKWDFSTGTGFRFYADNYNRVFILTPRASVLYGRKKWQGEAGITLVEGLRQYQDSKYNSWYNENNLSLIPLFSVRYNHNRLLLRLTAYPLIKWNNQSGYNHFNFTHYIPYMFNRSGDLRNKPFIVWPGFSVGYRFGKGK
ncbi:MAG: hypothetical protein K1X92_04645 [Bacteroidia bacterium]|nr:hypothetical protein [Bacteroidia bacterium]